MTACMGCGREVHESATTCPHCGFVRKSGGKSKALAAVLALFLGGIGIHRFYLGQWWGLIYLLFCWTFIPSVIALIEAIVFLCSSDANWNAIYGPQ